MSAVWRCRVCEAVNRGGRTCTTCGAVVPPGETVRAAVRTRTPGGARRARPAPVPPTPRRRDLRELPSPEEMVLMDPFGLFAGPDDEIGFRPVPGGCLYSAGPRRRRPRRWM